MCSHSPHKIAQRCSSLLVFVRVCLRVNCHLCNPVLTLPLLLVFIQFDVGQYQGIHLTVWSPGPELCQSLVIARSVLRHISHSTYTQRQIRQHFIEPSNRQTKLLAQHFNAVFSLLENCLVTTEAVVESTIISL